MEPWKWSQTFQKMNYETYSLPCWAQPPLKYKCVSVSKVCDMSVKTQANNTQQVRTCWGKKRGPKKTKTGSIPTRRTHTIELMLLDASNHWHTAVCYLLTYIINHFYWHSYWQSKIPPSVSCMWVYLRVLWEPYIPYGLFVAFRPIDNRWRACVYKAHTNTSTVTGPEFTMKHKSTWEYSKSIEI